MGVIWNDDEVNGIGRDGNMHRHKHEKMYSKEFGAYTHTVG
jgi:hypothetical protein